MWRGWFHSCLVAPLGSPGVLRGSRRLHRAPPTSRRLPGRQSIMAAAGEESRTPTIVLLLHFPVRLLLSTNIYILMYNLTVGGIVVARNRVRRS